MTTTTDVRVPEIVEHGDPDLLDPLKIADRCDRCRAQAYVSVIVSPELSEPLRFCHHDFEAAYVALLRLNDGAGPVSIRDERARLYDGEGRARTTGDDHA